MGVLENQKPDAGHDRISQTDTAEEDCDSDPEVYLGIESVLSSLAGRDRKSFTGRLLRLPLNCIPRSAVVTVLSGVNRGRRWIVGSATTTSSWVGNYEKDHADALEKLIRPGMTVYDVGANVGFYTLALSRLVGDSGRVYSFEPEARNSYMLQRHIALNQIRNVTVVQAAVGNSRSIVGFAGADERGRIAKGAPYQIPCITLDEFVANGNPLPDFFKMDIEGAEADALSAANHVLERHPKIMLATHGTEVRSECLKILTGYGYHFAGMDFVSAPGEDLIATVEQPNARR